MDDRKELNELIEQVATPDEIAGRMRNIADRPGCLPEMREFINEMLRQYAAEQALGDDARDPAHDVC
jgi:hypothetical protein